MSLPPPTLESLSALGPTRAAAVWLERLQHDAPEAEEALFQAWLGTSEANRAAWDAALDLWESFDAEGAPGELDALRREALRLRPRARLPAWAPYAAAASLALAAGVSVLAVDGRFLGTNPRTEVATAPAGPDLGRLGQIDYMTETGRQAQVVLADGSEITLDTDTAIDVAYQPGRRLVRLVRGQAYFSVAYDGARPFRVAAGGRVISVLGTRFNIRLDDGETRISLEQGQIGVTRGDDPAEPSGEPLRLTAGQQLVVQPGAPDRVVRPGDDADLRWRTGVVQFDRHTLAEAVAELNRYTSRKLVVRDPTVAAMRISGAFPTGDPERFTHALTALHPVRIVPLPNGDLEIVPRN